MPQAETRHLARVVNSFLEVSAAGCKEACLGASFPVSYHSNSAAAMSTLYASVATAAPAVPLRIPIPTRLLGLTSTGRRRLPAYQQTVVPASAPLIPTSPAVVPHDRRVWLLGLQRGMGVAGLIGFVLLAWVRAESLTRMMPHLLDFGLGLVAGLIGNSLGHWLKLLGMAPARACSASHTLKLAQIVGVPVGYVLLGGHMLLMPILGALLAATLVLVTRHIGWTKCSGAK